jgi:hypothetical protein
MCVYVNYAQLNYMLLIVLTKKTLRFTSVFTFICVKVLIIILLLKAEIVMKEL